MRKGLLIMLTLCALQQAQAQTGSTCDYWFDSNYAARETISMQGNSWNTEIDVGHLTDAVHTLHLQVTDADGRISPTASCLFVKLPKRMEQEAFTTDGTCRYWFDTDYNANKTLDTGAGQQTIDVGHLTDAVHTLHLQVTDADGRISPTASCLFVKLPKRMEQEAFTTDGTCRYWFDTDYSANKTLDTGAGLQTIDVSQLSAGVHTIHFLGNGTALTPTVSKLFVILPAAKTAETKITGYDYWVNDSDTPVSVSLPEPASPFTLTSLLPVAQQPLRSSCFHFAIEESQPVVYAKNDLRLRFYCSPTNFTDLKTQYVDYGVKATVDNMELLQPNRQTITTKPAANTIRWYQLTAEAGDLLRFRLDRAATLQVFAPSGQETYAAGSAASISWGEAIAEETGTYYVALHDVTSKKGTMVTIDYEHIDRYAVFGQDITTVGNGGPSTITFRGNGFDELTSVELRQGDATISSASVSAEGKTSASVKFDFSEAELGSYEAIFHFGDEAVEQKNSLTVEEAVPVSTSSTVAYAQQFLVSRGNDYTYRLTNHGNQTAYDVPMRLVVISTDADNLQAVTIDGQAHGAYTEEQDSTTAEGYPYKRTYLLWPTLRPSTTETLSVKVKTTRTDRIYVYLDEVGGASTPVTSIDPNDIYGYQDAEGSKTVSGGLHDVWYTIEFENDPAFATAPAHDIYITDQLSPEVFDLATFSPTRVKIGNKEARLDGGKHGVVTISMLPEIYALAQLEWQLDEETGLATWHISSLDPMTVEPAEDMMQGVLPVNSDGNGLGQLSFDISLKSALPFGTKVQNKATITFDDNKPITTPTWTNTVENISLGDVNGDGVIDAQDASLIQQFVARRFDEDQTGFHAEAADVNGDGEVTAQDASLVRQYAARKIKLISGIRPKKNSDAL